MEKDNLTQEENMDVKSVENSCKRKKCFIITPIGDESNPIRRHIDGLIDECIIPVLENEYKVTVAHRISKLGSINNQVIQEIYESELVIANLTKLNPNVMYELAFRHALKKPVIIIMEKDSEYKIPFDLVTERTIFYDNDFQGAINLKNELKQKVEIINNSKEEDIDNPIYSALAQLKQTESVIKNIKDVDKNEITSFQYIIKQIDDLKRELAVTRINKKEWEIIKKTKLFITRVKFFILIEEYNTEDEALSDIEKIRNTIEHFGNKVTQNLNIIGISEKSIVVDVISYKNEINNFINMVITKVHCASKIINEREYE